VRGGPLKPLYPGFSGLATAFGPTFELRFLGYFGVELDVLFANESSSAEMTVNDPSGNSVPSFDIDLGHGAVELPLLFKAVAPGKIASPMLFLGPLFVMPSDEADFDDAANPGLLEYSAYTESYTMFTFGLGVEVNVPIAEADLRVPFQVRGAYNPGVADDREGRTTHQPATGAVTEEAFSTQFKYSVQGQLGLALHF
jgi:hypothetical protein